MTEVTFRHLESAAAASPTEIIRMSGDRIDQLVAEYRNQLRLPWSRTLAGPQRVWMVVYDPELERRLRLKLEEFAIETREAGHAVGADRSHRFVR